MAKANEGSFHMFSLRRILLQRTHLSSENYRSSYLNDIEKGMPKTENLKNAQIDLKLKSTSENSNSESKGSLEQDDITCKICFSKELSLNLFFTLDLCKHRFCISCLELYLINEISESRTDIACPQCSVSIHPNNINILLKSFPEYKLKYEDFMIRRYLVTDPDTRWCPAPDCNYAVIATGCASCPELKCMRSNCGVSFCYHCKAEWHPDQTCDAARISRHKILRTSSFCYSQDILRRDDVKACPKCQVLIVKMNDGSCNHMICSVCGAEFCWLCMKEVSDLHYLSPSGCTFWGKKPWSRKKKIVWQIGTLIGAPVGIALLAGIAVPSMIIGIPLWVGRKLISRYKTKTKRKRNISVTIGVTASILISPILAGLAIAIGVPILLFYVYGIVPVSLCRASCTPSNEDYKRRIITDQNLTNYDLDVESIDTLSKIEFADIPSISIIPENSYINELSKNNANLKNNSKLHEISTIALNDGNKKHDMESFSEKISDDVENKTTDTYENKNL